MTRRRGKTSRRPSSSSVMRQEEKEALRVAYERRNRDLDPQLVWRGKDEQDASDLVASAPPLYIQEKVHPKVIIDDLIRQSSLRAERRDPSTPDLFADFNGLDLEAKTEFYQHDQQLVEPHDRRRLALGDGEPRRARGPARAGAVHLSSTRPTASNSTRISSGPRRRAT